MLMNLLEPHHFGAVSLAVLGIIALNCAIVHALSNFLGFVFVIMTGLARPTITNSKIAVLLALLGHIIVFHTVVLSAYSLIKLFIGTLYKTLDILYQVCYN